ncbi:hypothetical protein WAX74_15340 [Psychrobacillus sp. FJAT-51614]|uniref:DUF5673 domain-containing protein n=1 Tax=Psychrobacillus mangrovi TaxID=3117745 RepID=A0ABU8FAE2_9BACI
MLNQKSPRAILFIILILIIIIAPLFVLIFPLFSVETFHFERGEIVLISSGKNFYIVAIAFITLIIGVLTLIIKRNMITYILSGLFCLTFLVLMYASTISYTLIHKEYIVIQDITVSSKYYWEEISDVVYEYEVGSFGTYYFRTKEGDEFSIKENGQFGRDETREIAHIINIKHINYEKKQLK